MTTIRFANHNCKLAFDTYDMGGLAVELHTPNGALVATASLWVQGISRNLPANQFIVKTYSENEGILDALAPYVTVIRNVQIGHAICPVVELRPTAFTCVGEGFTVQADLAKMSNHDVISMLRNLQRLTQLA